MQSKGILPRAGAATLALASIPHLEAVAQTEQFIAPSEMVFVTGPLLRQRPPSETPAALSVFKAAALDSGHIQSPSDLVDHLSNVEVAQPFGNVFPAFVIRGIGLNDYNVNNNPTVGVYRDDVYLSSNAMIPKVLFDLQSVEVIKGPQGTLYGRNTTGGAVKLISNDPGEKLNGYAMAGYGNYNTVDLQGAVGGPIVGGLSARLAGFAERRFDGYQLDRTTGKESGEVRTWALRGIANYEAETLAFRLTLNGGQDKSDVQRFQHRGVLGPQCRVATQGIWDPTVCSDAFGYHDADADKLSGDYSLSPRMNDSNFGATFKADWTPAGWTLTSITNAEGYDYIHGNEEDASPQTAVEIQYNSRIRQFSQELRIASPLKREINWIFGGFFAQYLHNEHRRADIKDAEAAFGPLFGSPIVDLPYRQFTKTAAGFADIEWQFLKPFTLAGGIRYTNESISYRGGTVLPLLGNAPIVHVDDRFSDDNISWRLNLSYHPDEEDLLVYGQAGTGFKSGGFFGGFAFSPNELRPYRPETVTAYELGVKKKVDDRLTVEGAAFIYHYDDLQALAIRSLGAGGAVTIPTLTNLPGARVVGAELNLAWMPATGLSLRTELGLLDTKIEGPAFAFGSAGAAGPLFDLTDNQLPRSPHISLSETVSYERPIGASLSLMSEINVSFRSKAHMDLNNFAMATQPAYAVVNGSIYVNSSTTGWKLGLWVRNLTNVIPYLADGPVGFGERDLIVYGMPRTFGLTVRKTF